MNPYLKAKRAAYETHRVAVDELQTRAATEARDLTAAELESIQQHGRDAAALYDEIVSLTEVETRNAKVTEMVGEVMGGQEPVSLGGQPAADDPMPGLSPLMPSREQVVELHRAVAEQRPLRLTVADRPRGGHDRAVIEVDDAAERVQGLPARAPREPRRLAVAAGIAVQDITNVDGVSGVSFPVFGAGEALVVAEGATKPEYDAITPGEAKPQVIAVWTDTTRQALASVSELEVRLRQKHAALIAKAEDLLLITKVGATAGVQTITGASASAPYADTLLAAAAQVLASDVGAAPNVAVVNPLDVIPIFGGAVGRAGESPESELRLDLHGMTVYVSSGIAAGGAIVGAWQAASRFVVGMAPQVMVDPYSQMKKNIVTTLTEEAVDLAVDEPTGFVKVKFKPTT